MWHTSATLVIAAAVPILVIAERLGLDNGGRSRRAFSLTSKAGRGGGVRRAARRTILIREE
jgi:hypothetical protein